LILLLRISRLVLLLPINHLLLKNIFFVNTIYVILKAGPPPTRRPKEGVYENIPHFTQIKHAGAKYPS
jgi:hypothetical protein